MIEEEEDAPISTGFVRLPESLGGRVIQLDAMSVSSIEAIKATYTYIWTSDEGKECKLSLFEPLAEVENPDVTEPAPGAYIVNGDLVIRDAGTDDLTWLVFDQGLKSSNWYSWSNVQEMFGKYASFIPLWTLGRQT